MGNPIVVGIAGGSASGKSTFCNVLVEELKNLSVKTFHMDDYFKPIEMRPFVEAPITGNLYVDDNHPETVDLSRLKYDICNATQEEYHVIIVEGLLTLWDKEIYSKLDLKLFVDCRSDERIVRRLHRNMDWGLKFDEISKVYLDMVRYRHDEYVEPTKWKADLILNGSSPSKQAVFAIAGFIEKSCLNG
jgi:uridine kinase